MASVRSLICCGSCMYFQNNQIFGKPCNELGHLEFSKICVSYEPNIKNISKSVGEDNPAMELLILIPKLDVFTAETIAYLLICQSRISKYSRFKFMQPVVFRYQGNGQYLNNYCFAYVIDSNRENIRLISKNGMMVVSLPLKSATIHDTREFSDMRKSMVQSGKLIDPRNTTFTKMISVESLPARYKTERSKRNIQQIIKNK
jgi:hypothetical protein